MTQTSPETTNPSSEPQKGSIKEFCFMTRGGELCVAQRMTLYDAPDSMEMGKMEGYSIGILSHDGWAVYHPELCGGLTLFFNRECEKFMENLGEV